MAAVLVASRVRSWPAVSSSCHWFQPPPSKVSVWIPEMVPAWPTPESTPAANGGVSEPVYSWATTSGRSMSLSMKSTSTSVPMRGVNCEPQFGPASASATGGGTIGPTSPPNRATSFASDELT